MTQKDTDSLAEFQISAGGKSPERIGDRPLALEPARASIAKTASALKIIRRLPGPLTTYRS